MVWAEWSSSQFNLRVVFSTCFHLVMIAILLLHIYSDPIHFRETNS